jgi:hypothetical protein
VGLEISDGVKRENRQGDMGQGEEYEQGKG